MGAEKSANCVAQTTGARTQETYMYDITNLEKLSAFSKAVPEAMASCGVLGTFHSIEVARFEWSFFW